MEFRPEWVLVPLISGLIGYVTNWVAIKMLFFPVEMVGVRMPGLRALAGALPRRVQAIPGLVHGMVGWQGIIPSRAAKMGSIAVDKGIAKLGSPAEFYDTLDPEKIAAHILATARDDIRALVDRILEREHPQLWREAPAALREAVHARVQERLPAIVQDVTEQIGEHIDQLLDVKLMVIRHVEQRPELVNRIFLEVGDRELRFVVNAGFLFGFPLGIPTVLAFLALDGAWWVLPVAGVIVGYLTNLIAVRTIFLPTEPRRVGPLTFHGLFMRRQPEVARVYSKIIATDIINVENIGMQLLTGPRADRTRAMIEKCLRPAIDAAVGPARAAVRLAVGRREYDAIRESMASEAVEYAITPLTDPDFNRQQASAIEELLTARMRVLPPRDFAELLRSAMVEDEWMLISLGAVLGFAAGCLQLLTV